MFKRAVFAAGLLLTALPCDAAQVKLLIGGAMQEPFKAVGAAYARQSGNSLDFTIDTTGVLLSKLRSGVPADLILVSAPGMDALEKENRIAPGTRVDLARALVGVCVKAGAAVPDVSSEESFKQTILGARSISYVNPEAGGTSGTYMDGLFRKMGISEQVRAKVVWGYQGSQVAETVAKGQADIGITFISEMAPNKGVKIVGPLPESIQSATNYAAAIPLGAANPDAARAYLQMMTGPPGRAAIEKADLEPLH